MSVFSSSFVTLECPVSVVHHALCVNNYSVYTLEATILTQTSLNLLSTIVLMISQTSLIMGQMGSKSRSLGQFLEESCLHSRGHIFSPIFLKVGQNVCLDNISVKFDHGSIKVKHQVTRSNLRKILFTLQGPHFLPNLPQNWSECQS